LLVDFFVKGDKKDVFRLFGMDLNPNDNSDVAASRNDVMPSA